LHHEVLSFVLVSAVFGSPVAFCPQFTQDGAKREEEFEATPVAASRGRMGEEPKKA
jgi:hypothetical protein